MLDLNFVLNYAEKLGAEYAEARLEKNEQQVVMLKNGKTESPLSSTELGLGIRVLKGGMSFVSLNNLDKKHVKQAVERAVKLAEKSYPIKLSEEKASKEKEIIKGKVATTKEKLDFLKSLDSVAHLPRIISRIFMLYSTKTEKWFLNSEGSNFHTIIPRQMLEYSLIAADAGKMEQRYFYFGNSGGWEVVDRWKAREKIAEEASTLVKLLNAPRFKTKKTDVVLSPELVGIIVHESCGHPSEADRILGREAAQAGECYMKPGWIGKQIGSEAVTIIDDPTLPKSYGYYRWDDEGVPARPRILFKNGRINEFLHNRETAWFFGTKSNAAARASNYSREPIVRMANTYMAPGEYSFDELIEGVKHGVYIKSFTEWNIDDKRWNEKYVGAEAYLIENGKLTGLVRHPVIETTTPQLYSAVDACGKDLSFVPGTCGKGEPMQGVPVWMGGPHIRLRAVLVKGG